MITATQLLEEHENDFGGRPQRIQALRDPIRQYTGLEVPRSLPAVPDWYDEHEAEMTNALNEQLDDSDSDSGTDSTAADADTDGGTDADADADADTNTNSGGDD